MFGRSRSFLVTRQKVLFWLHEAVSAVISGAVFSCDCDAKPVCRLDSASRVKSCEPSYVLQVLIGSLLFHYASLACLSGWVRGLYQQRFDFSTALSDWVSTVGLCTLVLLPWQLLKKVYVCQVTILTISL